ncbi:hypothetical protein NDU88_007036 [Pleurodeles waltl]|uniref:Lamina-associated polypeptide 2 alpha C-terminal domain-containing protein n=1 Tax=Pleurodeles waltl TaxID=8319 RepID=A0AAV7QQC8_PLEWA|nr:hypothetical protein NDU88_007036 [Pleurodeles waltl]
MGRWADPLVGSLRLGRLCVAEASGFLLPSVNVVVMMERSPWCADGCKVLPDSVPTDSFVASFVDHTSLAEDAAIRDSVDKKVDVSVKKSYAGTHLALRAGIYGTYVAQSLLSDLKALKSALDGSSDCSGLMSLIERQVEFLSHISFDEVRASALAEGACVSARWNLVLRDWETDAAQHASALWLSFQGNVLFGAELEEKLHKLFKEKKHSSSFRSTLEDRRLFCRKSSVQAPPGISL